jgi:rRNA maturation RNase YbeY
MKIEIKKTIKRKFKLNKTKVKKLISQIVKEEEKKVKEINVTFVGKKYIQQLNFKYRNKNLPTNVIAFPIEIEKELLCDIYLCLDEMPRVMEKEEGAVFLIIHGVLHTLGYEHSEEMEKKGKYYLNLWNSL